MRQEILLKVSNLRIQVSSISDKAKLSKTYFPKYQTIIQIGEEINDIYSMHYSEIPKSSRKEWLHKNFLFNCDCKACQENWPTFDGLPTVSMTEIQRNHLR